MPPKPDTDIERPEVPGDTGAPDIVSPTGEEMPVATHDEIGDRVEEAPDGQPIDGNVPHPETTGVDGEPARDRRAPSAGGDIPRTLL